MKEKTIQIRTVEDGHSKIGVIFEEKTNIIVPMFYMDSFEKLSSEITKQEKAKLKLLVKAWAKYQDSTKGQKETNTKANEGLQYSFSVIIDLIQDFLDNGLYTEFEYIDHLRRCGKIEFAKTVKNAKPLYTEQGPVYLEYITRGKKINDEDIIKAVQILVLNEIAQNLGWMLGFNIVFPLESVPISLSSSTASRLRMIRDTSYNSRKIRLLNNLISYIVSSENEDEKGRGLFVGTGYHFWESMISSVLGNVKRSTIKKDFFVRHSYVSRFKERNIKKMDPLEPDAVYLSDEALIILDAKYYSYGKLPINDDITKQFAYMVKAFHVYGDREIVKNIFVLPTKGNSHFSDVLCTFDNSVPAINEFVPIEVMYINYDELLNAYISNKKIDIFSISGYH
ncbi:LlaJI family restriction endonuclease [Clostridium cochlearium]|uniref:LlaJI family restriction endonuclease n=1 Tax=Clostridium cochlearium TaxID=1494 RepID=UPI00241CB1F7|nr:LlaJI family restriction endonuclease [Clostridium cochlearium]MBE6066041.1 LlaJI family restriction endonuclease [Clostridium cochlearium]